MGTVVGCWLVRYGYIGDIALGRIANGGKGWEESTVALTYDESVMTARVTEQTGKIRGVNVRWVHVIVAGHTVEQVLSFDVAEAESVHGRPFDDDLDKHIQMGMFAMDRISADGTMGKVASATSYVLDGKCIRTAKIEHRKDIEPMSAGWLINRADGSEVHQEPWSCVRGTPPMPHTDLHGCDDDSLGSAASPGKRKS